MIQVVVWRDNSNGLVLIEVKGHADYAPHGHDIVCSAVSVLTQTTIMALQRFLSIDPLAEKSQGYLKISLPENLTLTTKKNAFLLLETMLLGLRETASSYPGFIVFKEMNS